MIDAAEALRVIGEAQAELAGPLLNPRYEDRVIFVGDTHGAIDVTQTVIDKFFDDADLIVFLDDYLCLHGGIAKGMEHVSEIASLPWPDLNPDDPIAFQLLWNDPRDVIDEFVPSVRGKGAFYYGTEATKTFLENNSLKGIIRGHEVV